MKRPNYNLILKDMIKFDNAGMNDVSNDKYSLLESFHIKNSLDLIYVSDKLFKKIDSKENKKLYSYQLQDIDYILDYAEKSILPKYKIAKLFNISKTTLNKWIRKRKSNIIDPLIKN